jgi:hypothetical protein
MDKAHFDYGWCITNKCKSEDWGKTTTGVGIGAGVISGATAGVKVGAAIGGKISLPAGPFGWAPGVAVGGVVGGIIGGVIGWITVSKPGACENECFREEFLKAHAECLKKL